jgi:C-3',4' desaturase CrtD
VNVVDRPSGSVLRQKQPDVLVIGAGISGLTAAAFLARSGARVQVVERHTIPGGCASFYQRKGFRFDVGATLASGFGPRGVHRALFALLGADVPAEAVEPSMVVHVGGDRVQRFGDARWIAERRRAFGSAADAFWTEQERIADLAWDFSTRFPMLPADAAGAVALAGAFRLRHAPLVRTIGRTVADILPRPAGAKLRAFVDAQLLITAQGDAAATDLSYGCTALDIAREGTFHLPLGVSGIAVALARAARRHGGAIAYGTSVAEILVERGRAAGIRLADGTAVHAPCVVAAVPVQNVAALLGPAAAPLAGRIAALPQHWGAFMAYVGLPPADIALHHQIVLDEHGPPGEGNTTFVSFSAPGERERARGGGRAVTISTHTDVARWERAYAAGSYDALKRAYGERLRCALDRVAPGAWEQAEVVELATPHTFAAYTGRLRGLVGGLPQTPANANLRALSHESGIAGLLLCGDTVFPGQSTVGASLSGLAAARAAQPFSLSSSRSMNLARSVM